MRLHGNRAVEISVLQSALLSETFKVEIGVDGANILRRTSSHQILKFSYKMAVAEWMDELLGGYDEDKDSAYLPSME